MTIRGTSYIKEIQVSTNHSDKSQVKNKNVIVALCGNGQLVAPRVPANLQAAHLDNGSRLLWFVFIFSVPL